jgi:hypothetical protein
MGVSKRVQAGVLAAAALASIAVAGVRIAGAAGHRASALDEETRAYATANALAGATLAKLRTPPGFRAGRCISPTPGSECFSRSRSMPLSHATMGRLLASFGVKRYSVYGGDPVACFRTKHFKKPRLTLQACQVEALVGDERFVLYATSLVVSGPDWVRGTTRTVPHIPHPSELTMDVIGHLDGT